jgi:hypothetical protein
VRRKLILPIVGSDHRLTNDLIGTSRPRPSNPAAIKARLAATPLAVGYWGRGAVIATRRKPRAGRPLAQAAADTECDASRFPARAI